MWNPESGFRPEISTFQSKQTSIIGDFPLVIMIFMSYIMQEASWHSTNPLNQTYDGHESFTSRKVPRHLQNFFGKSGSNVNMAVVF